MHNLPTPRRHSRALLATGSMLLGGALLLSACAAEPGDSAARPFVSAGGQYEIPAFYEPPSPLPDGKHGDLIRSEEAPAPDGARAWRILYLSELGDGSPVAVSGFVVVPDGKAPKDGRKVIAWAHGTEGGGRNCAPSLVAQPAMDLVDYFDYNSSVQQDPGVPSLTEMLDAGYAVVATDYQGLGTPGDHEYTVMETETNNVWDSVKAAQQLEETGAGNDMAVLGWSQGGGASVWMAQNTEYGAPLKLVGAAGLAPAANNGPQFAKLVEPGPANSTSQAHGVALELNVVNGLMAAYPELEASGMVTPEGEKALVGAANQCVNHLAYVLNSNITDPYQTLMQPSTPADWQKRLDENTAGNTAPLAPILVMQGTADTVVNPNATTQYIGRVCGFGKPVQYTLYADATHQTIPGDASGEYMSWFADRFAGVDAPTTCAPAGSAQTAPEPISVPNP